MNLSENQQKILQAIQKGPGSARSVSILTNLDPSDVNEYMDYLEAEGYITGAKRRPTDQIGAAEYSYSNLTGKGRVAINESNNNVTNHSAPKYDFRGAQFAGGFAETVQGNQVGGVINHQTFNGPVGNAAINNYGTMSTSPGTMSTPPETLQNSTQMEWTGKKIAALHEALLSAYPRQAEIKRLLRAELDLRLNTLAGGSNYSETLDALLEALEAENRLLEFALAAHRNKPTNVKLKAFIQSLSADPQQTTAQNLQVQQGPSFEWRGSDDDRQLEGLLTRREVDSYDVAFIQQASQPAAAVCRVELPNEESIGTGFLIAKNLLLTNYHVIALEEDSDPHELLDQITLRFGYLTTKTGQGAQGQTFKLAPQPLLKFQTVDQGLDYALLKIEDAILTDHSLQPVRTSQGRPPNPDTNIHVLQHPEGQTLKVAFSNNGITGVYERDGLIQYVSNTSVGSSGSPCFNDNWELVAVHHAQVPATFGVKCEGILYQAIYRDIASVLSEYLTR